MPAINDPAVVAEIAQCCEAYEKALVANDVPTLTRFFWDSPHAVRFGVGEQLYGAEEISAFRQKRVINFTERRATRFTVLALGADVGIAMLEFSVMVAGTPRQGRQTQVWVRFENTDWKIASAHVSHAVTAAPDPWLAFVDRAAAALQLPVDNAYRAAVADNVKRTAEVAGPLLAFALPPTTEPAPIFKP